MQLNAVMSFWKTNCENVAESSSIQLSGIFYESGQSTQVRHAVHLLPRDYKKKNSAVFPRQTGRQNTAASLDPAGIELSSLAVPHMDGK